MWVEVILLLLHDPRYVSTAVVECKEEIANAWQSKNDNGLSYGILEEVVGLSISSV